MSDKSFLVWDSSSNSWKASESGEGKFHATSAEEQITWPVYTALQQKNYPAAAFDMLLCATEIVSFGTGAMLRPATAKLGISALELRNKSGAALAGSYTGANIAEIPISKGLLGTGLQVIYNEMKKDAPGLPQAIQNNVHHLKLQENLLKDVGLDPVSSPNISPSYAQRLRNPQTRAETITELENTSPESIKELRMQAVQMFVDIEINRTKQLEPFIKIMDGKVKAILAAEHVGKGVKESFILSKSDFATQAPPTLDTGASLKR